MEKTHNKKNTPRIVAVVVLIAVAAAAFSYGIGKFFSSETGYKTIECTANETNCSSDFVFTYHLGVSGVSPTAELRSVTSLYNEKAVYYYRLFNAYETFDPLVNIAYINNHVNEMISVPSELYRSLKEITASEKRYLFLGPVYSYYDTLLSSSFDEDAAVWDPLKNPELADEYNVILSFINDKNHIDLQLFEGSMIRLTVSNEYLRYADEVGITDFIDFYWTKNAFIADCFADDLSANGFDRGVICSKDGFIRNADQSDDQFSYDHVDQREQNLVVCAKLNYSGQSSICNLHPFVIDEHEKDLVYQYSDSTVITRYISPDDALSRNGSGSVTAYSKSLGCAELLMSVLPYYLDNSIFDCDIKTIGLIYSDGALLRNVPSDGFTVDIY